MTFPRQCYSCRESASDDKYVMLHCECCIALCKNCARRQVGLQHNTFFGGVRCPKCRGNPFTLSKPKNGDSAIVDAPQIFKIKEAEAEERKLILRAYDYYNIVERRTEKINRRQRLVDAFQRDGYLLFLRVHSYREESRFLDLCLARAECLRHETISKGLLTPDENIGPEELPLGPLAVIDFQHNSTLALAISPAGLLAEHKKCVACLDEMIPGSSVMFTCSCFSVMCQSCMRTYIGTLANTFHPTPGLSVGDSMGDDTVGIQCHICHCLSFTVTGGVAARNEETRLVEQALKRTCWAERRKSARGKFSKADLQKCHASFESERIEGFLSVGDVDMILQEKSGVSEHRVLLEIARLELKRERQQRVTAAKAITAEAKTSEDDDVVPILEPVLDLQTGEDILPFGPLGKLKFKKNIFLELALAGGRYPAAEPDAPQKQQQQHLLPAKKLDARGSNLSSPSSSSTSFASSSSSSSSSSAAAVSTTTASSGSAPSATLGLQHRASVRGSTSPPSILITDSIDLSLSASPTFSDSRASAATSHEVIDADGSSDGDSEPDTYMKAMKASIRRGDAIARIKKQLPINEHNEHIEHSNSSSRRNSSAVGLMEEEQLDDEDDDEVDSDARSQNISASSSKRSTPAKVGKKPEESTSAYNSSGSKRKSANRANTDTNGVWDCDKCGKRLRSRRGLRRHITQSHPSHRKSKKSGNAAESDGDDDDDYNNNNAADDGVDREKASDEEEDIMVEKLSRTQIQEWYASLDSPDAATTDSAYLCPHCRVVCVNAQALKTHILYIHPDVAATIELDCKVCGKKLTAATMRNHMKRAHRINEDTRKPRSLEASAHGTAKTTITGTGATDTDFRCPFCANDFSSLHSLQRHIDRKHQEPGSPEDSDPEADKKLHLRNARKGQRTQSSSSDHHGSSSSFVDLVQTDTALEADINYAGVVSSQSTSNSNISTVQSVPTSTPEGEKSKAFSSHKKRNHDNSSHKRHSGGVITSKSTNNVGDPQDEITTSIESAATAKQSDSTHPISDAAAAAVPTVDVDANGMRKSYKKVQLDDSDDYSYNTSEDDARDSDKDIDGANKRNGRAVTAPARPPTPPPTGNAKRPPSHSRNRSHLAGPPFPVISNGSDHTSTTAVTFPAIVSSSMPAAAKPQKNVENSVERSSSSGPSTSMRPILPQANNVIVYTRDPPLLPMFMPSAETAVRPVLKDAANVVPVGIGAEVSVSESTSISLPIEPQRQLQHSMMRPAQLESVSQHTPAASHMRQGTVPVESIGSDKTNSSISSGSRESHTVSNGGNSFTDCAVFRRVDYDGPPTATQHTSSVGTATAQSQPSFVPSLDQALAALRKYILQCGASIPMDDFSSFERLHPRHAEVINRESEGRQLTDLFREYPRCNIEFLAGWYYATGDDENSSESNNGGAYRSERQPLPCIAAPVEPIQFNFETALLRPAAAAATADLNRSAESSLHAPAATQEIADPYSDMANFIVGARVEVNVDGNDRWSKATIIYVRPDSACDVRFDDNRAMFAVPIAPRSIRLLDRAQSPDSARDTSHSKRQESHCGGEHDDKTRDGRVDDGRDDGRDRDIRGAGSDADDDTLSRSRSRSRSNIRRRQSRRDRTRDRSNSASASRDRQNRDRSENRISSQRRGRSRSRSRSVTSSSSSEISNARNYPRRRSSSSSNSDGSAANNTRRLRRARSQHDDAGNDRKQLTSTGMESCLLRAQGKDRDQLLVASKNQLRRLKICIHWAQRICQNGGNCRFVHSNLMAIPAKNDNIPSSSSSSSPDGHSHSRKLTARSAGVNSHPETLVVRDPGDNNSSSVEPTLNAELKGGATTVNNTPREAALATFFEKESPLDPATVSSKRALEDKEVLKAERIKRVKAAMNIIVNTKQLPVVDESNTSVPSTSTYSTATAVTAPAPPVPLLSEEDVALLEEATSASTPPTANAAYVYDVAKSRNVQVVSLFRRLSECWKNDEEEAIVVLGELAKADLTKEELISNQEAIKLVFALQKKDQSRVAAVAKALTDVWLQQHRRSASQNDSSMPAQLNKASDNPSDKVSGHSMGPTVTIKEEPRSFSSSSTSRPPLSQPTHDTATASSSSGATSLTAKIKEESTASATLKRGRAEYNDENRLNDGQRDIRLSRSRSDSSSRSSDYRQSSYYRSRRPRSKSRSRSRSESSDSHRHKKSNNAKNDVSYTAVGVAIKTEGAPRSKADSKPDLWDTDWARPATMIPPPPALAKRIAAKEVAAGGVSAAAVGAAAAAATDVKRGSSNAGSQIHRSGMEDSWNTDWVHPPAAILPPPALAKAITAKEGTAGADKGAATVSLTAAGRSAPVFVEPANCGDGGDGDDDSVNIMPLTAASLAAINAAARFRTPSSLHSLGTTASTGRSAIATATAQRPPATFTKKSGSISWDEAALLLHQFAIDQGGHFLARDMQAFYARYDRTYDNLRDVLNIGPKKFVLKYPKLLSFNSRCGGMIIAVKPKNNVNRLHSNLDLPYGSDEEDIYIGSDSDDDDDEGRNREQHRHHHHNHDNDHKEGGGNRDHNINRTGFHAHHPSNSTSSNVPQRLPPPPLPSIRPPPPYDPTDGPQYADRRTIQTNVPEPEEQRTFTFPRPAQPALTADTFSTAAFFLVPDDFDKQQLPPPPPPSTHNQGKDNNNSLLPSGTSLSMSLAAAAALNARDSSQVISAPSIATRQPDYAKAWQILQTDEKLLDAERLKNYLRDLGVTSAEDLGDCEEKWIENITKLVKPLPLRQLNRFLGRDVNDS